MSFHVFHINELYSNADGTVQFIEFVGDDDNQQFWSGHTLTATQGAITHTFSFTTDLPSSATAGRSVLVATQGFADLGIVTPNYIVPNGFLFTSGSVSVNFPGMDSMSNVVLPRDGSLSISGSSVTAVNSPTNFAGQTGTVVLSGPPVSAIPLVDPFAGNGQAFEFIVPANAFTDPDNDTLSYSATLAGGGPLPVWLTFDDVTRTFSGTPGPSDTGVIDVRVTVSDNSEGSTSDVFSLSVLSGHVVTGTAAGELLTGTAAADRLAALGGNDTLEGAAGNDTLLGGAGNDTYMVDAAGDNVIETSAADGTDLVVSSVSFTLGANLENLTLTGGGAISATGNALANVLTGNSGDNVLDGGAGNDMLAGGDGNDTYLVAVTGDVTTEQASNGTDLVLSPIAWTLAANLENLTLTGTASVNATGNAQANVLTGNAGDNVLDGQGGADTLAGGDGNDTMTGGAGNDTYFVVEIGDVVIETGGGNDTVISSRSISLAGTAAGIENLTLLAGSAAQSATGNAQDNVLTGNRNDNVLSGGAGNDVLQGGRGYDLMAGGAGNDTYYVNRGDGAGTSRLAPFEDQVVEALNAGTDTVYSSMYTYTLDANVENLVLEGVGRKGFGNALNNTLTGNALNNTFAGGAGNDRFAFGSLDGSVDRILDYNVANDTIQLSLAVFQGIGTIGNFNVNAFVSNGAPVALEAGDRILYNSTTGALYYDADGSDAGVAVQFALLSGAPALTFADIAVIA